MPEVTFHIGENPGQIVIHIVGSDKQPIDSKAVSKLVSVLNVWQPFATAVKQVADAIVNPIADEN